MCPSHSWASHLPPSQLYPLHGEDLECNDADDGEWQLNGGGCAVPEGLWLGNLLNQDASDCCHGPAGVLELSLAEPLQLLRVDSQTEGVEAKVSCVGHKERRITCMCLSFAMHSKTQEVAPQVSCTFTNLVCVNHKKRKKKKKAALGNVRAVGHAGACTAGLKACAHV